MASINRNTNTGINKSIIVNGVDNTDLPNTFNSFFTRFERSDPVENISACKNSLEPHNEIVISQGCVTALFKKVKLRNAAGPDSVCECTLHHCADQLRGVFSRLFQMCADFGHTPRIWKMSTIKLIPKSKDSKELRDFRPLAFTSLVMKIVEKILKNIMVFSITGKLDPLQFAYQPGKSKEDAKLFILDTLHKHLELMQDFYLQTTS